MAAARETSRGAALELALKKGLTMKSSLGKDSNRRHIVFFDMAFLLAIGVLLAPQVVLSGHQEGS
eukprot:2066652-Amphidinium_carterae.1